MKIVAVIEFPAVWGGRRFAGVTVAGSQFLLNMQVTDIGSREDGKIWHRKFVSTKYG